MNIKSFVDKCKDDVINLSMISNQLLNLSSIKKILRIQIRL